LKVCPHADCPSGGEPQETTNFYEKPDRGDGLSGWCRVCHTREGGKTKQKYLATEHGRARAAATAARRIEDGRLAAAKEKHKQTPRYRETLRAYLRTDAVKARTAAYRREHAAKISARAAINNAVLAGKMTPITGQTCVRCGQPATEYHHRLGYALEYRLTVEPVCAPCHRRH
jgi:hypothetical protein